MRFLPAILVFAFIFTSALRATDFPTVKAVLPEINTAQGSAIPAIDLRDYFEVTSIQGPVAQFRTSLGTYNLELFPAAAPATVPNFLTYVNGGRYADTFIHRSDQGLGVIQGGGYEVTATDPLNVERIATDPPIVLEYNLPNTRGTIAMARTAVHDSATSEWFINTDDNTTTLGQANGGGYAVFGRVTGTGMTVVDAIHALTVYNAGGAFGQLPLINYTSGPATLANLVMINGAESVPIFPTAAGQNSVIRFSVTSNTNPTLVTATVSASSLNLTLAVGQVGIADLTVAATDTNGNAVQSSFRVNVTDAPPEIAVEQPAGNALADGGGRAFPVVSVGSNGDLIFTIKNTGTGGLLLTGSPSVAVDGPDAGMFTVTPQPAPALVSLDGNTTFTVRFAPTSEGMKTAALHIANTDSDETPFDINLTGTGNARPTLTLPASPVTTTATSANGAVVLFTVTADDAEDGPLTPTVAPPSGSTFAVGDTIVQVSATDSNGAQTSGSFTVRVLPQPPEIVVEQPVGNVLADNGGRAFLLVNVGSTEDLTFTINNTGDGGLLLTGTPNVAVDGPDAGMFTVTSQPASSVAALGGSTTFTVRFAPTSGGMKTAALHIANTDSDENPFDINLTGVGNARPTLTLPASPVTATATSANGAVVSFGVTASDAEDGPLTPTVVPPSGSTFSVGDTTVQVSATDSNGAQTTGSFTVRVLPQPQEIAVEQPAGNDVSDGGNRAFPVVNVGSTADLNFTIKNVGGGNVALTGNPKVVVDGPDASDFSVITQPTSPIAGPSGSTTFTVRFAPTSAGLKSAALHIANDDSDENPFDINLTGTGNALPALTLPNSPVTAEPTSSSGAVVDFQVTANDAEDGPLTPMVTPPSGSTFPLGDTIVNVSATDANGAVTTGGFTVSVRFQRPAETTVTISAQSGEAAPGAGTGGLPANAVLQSFGPPAINDFRVLAARVTLSAGSALLPGIYVEDGAGLGRMAAYKGGSVPGIPSTATTFKKFSEPVTADDGSVAFIGTLTGGGVNTTQDTGVWTDAFGSGMELILREGSQVPGLPTGAKLKAVSSISLHNGELLALLTLKLAKGVVTDANDMVLLHMTGADTATVLLREGRALNGFGASKIKSFRVLSPAQGSPGHGRWHGEGTVIAKVTLHDGRTLLVKLATDETPTPILSTADAATPISPSARWKGFGLPAIGSAGAGFTVAATLKPDVGGVLERDNQVLLVRSDGATWSVLARKRNPAPVIPAGPRYAGFFDPLVNEAGHVAFLAMLQGAGVNADNEMALFGGPANDPQLIARLGDPAPDESGATTTAVWSKLITCALPSGPGAGPIFLAKTTGGDTNTTNNLALWAADSQGTVRRLLRTGDALTTGGPPITSLKLLNAAPGAFGVTRSFNASGSVALVATFADGTQALLRVDIP